MNTTISAMLVAWSAMRSRYFPIDCRRCSKDFLRVVHHEPDDLLQKLGIQRVDQLLTTEYLTGLEHVRGLDSVESVSEHPQSGFGDLIQERIERQWPRGACSLATSPLAALSRFSPASGRRVG
jgi:hypothetical protein